MFSKIIIIISTGGCFQATDEAVDRPTGKSLIPNKEMFV